MYLPYCLSIEVVRGPIKIAGWKSDFDFLARLFYFMCITIKQVFNCDTLKSGGLIGRISNLTIMQKKSDWVKNT
ncbi:hypothetical protein Pla144_03580 [Bythopirellula polymerisocia]|uniref:Uncharacterized protein n=1 Tax=Bythopirellula polymerisocia TaxID=2528003 RepID=A0A5C6CYE3_9BACT|nr:hypothetical protein Pla144_03580 [Bythopirellula polymerisocia]